MSGGTTVLLPPVAPGGGAPADEPCRARVGRLLAGRRGQDLRVQVRAGPGVVQTLKLERKDVLVELQHPCADLDAAEAFVAAARQKVQATDVETVWSLLEDKPPGLGEVTQLLLGAAHADARDTVAAALACADDAFCFKNGQLRRRSAAERQQHRAELATQARLEAEIAPWLQYIDHVRIGGRKQRDVPWLARLEAYARDPAADDPAVARLLTLRGRRAGTSAHDAAELLTELGAWDPHEDLELLRSGLLAPFAPELEASLPPAPRLGPGCVRLDLPFVTIDNDAPHEVDDAVYAEPLPDEGTRLWLAIASPSCWLDKGTPLDLLAMDRGTTLYHPRYVAGMLPDRLARDLASLQVGAWRPALVMRVDLDREGRMVAADLREAEVRVAAAWSYSRLDAILAQVEAPGDVDVTLLERLRTACLRSEAHRIRNGAYLLYKPDVEVRAPAHGAIRLDDSSQTSPSRRLVTEAMVLCGAAAARYAVAHHVAVPFRCQARPVQPALPPGLYTAPADVFTVFRALGPARYSLQPDVHGVMAVDAYVQVTSPLRRYVDLVAQRQLLAHLRGEPAPYSATELVEAIARAEQGQQTRRQWQRRADRYFKLVYVAGRGIGARLQGQLVRSLSGRGEMLAYVAELALEVTVQAPRLEVGDHVELVVRRVAPRAGDLAVALAPR